MEWVLRSVYGLVSLGLLWAALADVRTRRVPRPAGWGLLFGGLGLLLVGQYWLAALFYLGVLAASMARGALPILALAGLGLLVWSQDPARLALLVGLGYVYGMFRAGWLGGGDAQLAMGLIAIGGDWLMLGYLFGAYVALALLVVLVRHGLAGAARRWVFVAAHLGAAGQDPAAIRVPWAVFACLGGWAYLWLLPGLIWR